MHECACILQMGACECVQFTNAQQMQEALRVRAQKETASARVGWFWKLAPASVIDEGDCAKKKELANQPSNWLDMQSNKMPISLIEKQQKITKQFAWRTKGSINQLSLERFSPWLPAH